MIKQLCTIGIALLCTFPLAAQQKPWVSAYDASTAFDLDATRPLDTLAVPLKLDGALSFRQVGVAGNRPLFVRLNNKFQQSYIDAFHILKNDSAFLLVVDLRMLSESGAYQSLFIFTAPGRPNQEVALSFNRPAAHLDTVRTVCIHIEGNTTRSDPFMVRETGGRSGVSQLTISPPLFNGFTATDVVIFSVSPRSVSAGCIFTTEYHLNDSLLSHLPLGITAGTAAINAPELSGPVFVPFQIINTRSKLWIIGVTFLGILLGAFVRHYIKDRRALEASRVQGYNLIDRILSETADIKDAPFQAAIDRLVSALEAVLKSSDEPSMDAAIKKTLDSYNDLTTKFEGFLSGVHADIRALAGCFSDPVLLALRNPFFSDAASHFSTASQDLSDRNTTAAQNDIVSTVSGLNRFIIDYTTRVGGLVAQMGGFAFYPLMTSSDVVDQVKEKAKDIATAIALIKPDKDAAKEIEIVIGRLSDVQANLVSALQYLQGAVSRFVDAHVSALTDPAMAQFATAFQAWNTAMEELITDPYQTMDPALVVSLNDAWHASTGGANKKFGAPIGAAASSTAPAPLPWMAKGATVLIAPDAVSSPGTITLQAAKARKSLFWLTVVQVFFLSIILGLIFYKTYGPTFIGTTDELITLFLLGFSIDVTVDSVMQLGGSKGR